jgi:hypothetical protein
MPRSQSQIDPQLSDDSSDNEGESLLKSLKEEARSGDKIARYNLAIYLQKLIQDNHPLSPQNLDLKQECEDQLRESADQGYKPAKLLIKLEDLRRAAKTGDKVVRYNLSQHLQKIIQNNRLQNLPYQDLQQERQTQLKESSALGYKPAQHLYALFLNSKQNPEGISEGISEGTSEGIKLMKQAATSDTFEEGYPSSQSFFGLHLIQLSKSLHQNAQNKIDGQDLATTQFITAAAQNLSKDIESPQLTLPIDDLNKNKQANRELEDDYMKARSMVMSGIAAQPQDLLTIQNNAAKAGNFEAKYQRSLILLGNPDANEEAIKLLSESAKSYLPAKFAYALYHLAVDSNKQKGTKLLKEASDAGYAPGNLEYAQYLKEEGYSFLKSAATNNSQDQESRLFYLVDLGLKYLQDGNEEDGLKYLKQAAKQQSPQASYELGCYFMGLSLEKHEPEAKECKVKGLTYLLDSSRNSSASSKIKLQDFYFQSQTNRDLLRTIDSQENLMQIFFDRKQIIDFLNQAPDEDNFKKIIQEYAKLKSEEESPKESPNESPKGSQKNYPKLIQYLMQKYNLPFTFSPQLGFKNLRHYVSELDQQEYPGKDKVIETIAQLEFESTIPIRPHSAASYLKAEEKKNTSQTATPDRPKSAFAIVSLPQFDPKVAQPITSQQKAKQADSTVKNLMAAAFAGFEIPPAGLDDSSAPTSSNTTPSPSPRSAKNSPRENNTNYTQNTP